MHAPAASGGRAARSDFRLGPDCMICIRFPMPLVCCFGSPAANAPRGEARATARVLRGVVSIGHLAWTVTALGRCGTPAGSRPATKPFPAERLRGRARVRRACRPGRSAQAATSSSGGVTYFQLESVAVLGSGRIIGVMRRGHIRHVSAAICGCRGLARPTRRKKLTSSIYQDARGYRAWTWTLCCVLHARQLAVEALA